MREIVFDTETTGLDARGGDRLVEIGDEPRGQSRVLSRLAESGDTVSGFSRLWR